MAAEERTMPCHKRMRVIGYGWVRSTSGWDRYFIRDCSDCQHVHIDKLLWVNTDYPFCLTCFGQALAPNLDGFQVNYRCVACGHTHVFEGQV